MRDVHGGDAELALQVLELLPELVPELGIQVGQRLVQQEDLGPQHQRPGHGHALLLATGQLGNVLVQLLIAELHPARDVAHQVVRLSGFFFPHPQPEGDVLPDAHAGEQGIVLEHHAHLPLVAR